MIKNIIVCALGNVKTPQNLNLKGIEFKMGLEVFIAPLIGIAIIFALIKIIELPFWLLKNSIVGAIILYIINFIGIFTIKVTFIHCLIVGVFGVPGIVGLLIYLNYLQ